VLKAVLSWGKRSNAFGFIAGATFSGARWRSFVPTGLIYAQVLVSFIVLVVVAVIYVDYAR